MYDVHKVATTTNKLIYSIRSKLLQAISKTANVDFSIKMSKELLLISRFKIQNFLSTLKAFKANSQIGKVDFAVRNQRKYF